MKKILSLFLFIAILAFAGVAHAKPAAADAAAPAAAAAPIKFTPSVTNVIGEPHEWGTNMQEGYNSFESKMRGFHIYMLWIIIPITIFVLLLIAYIVIRFNAKANPTPSKTTHNTMLEIIWTVIPILIVVAITIPSIKLLYYADRTEKADMTLKVVGYQWYWSYELPDQKVAEFESHVIPEEKLQQGQRRLFDVDEPLVLPVGKTVRVLVTADPLGVIHSWGVPGLAFKRDAIPGRINEGWFKIEKPGIYYGECYQLCGVDHAFMPIKIIAVSNDEFKQWVTSKGGQPAGAEPIDGNENKPGSDTTSAAPEAQPAANKQK